MEISQITIYPIKSLSGVNVNSANTTKFGLELDHRWMVVDENNRGMQQRFFNAMSLLGCQIIDDQGILVFHKLNPQQNILVPYKHSNDQITVFYKQDTIEGVYIVSEAVNNWFSDVLQVKQCKVVYFPNNAVRRVSDNKYTNASDYVAFHKKYPYFMYGQASLDKLNEVINDPEKAMTHDRFRPNFVFKNGLPFAEDKFGVIKIGQDVTFRVATACPRCPMTQINQQTGEILTEPIESLMKFRKAGGVPIFGMTALLGESGQIKVGDTLEVETLDNTREEPVPEHSNLEDQQAKQGKQDKGTAVRVITPLNVGILLIIIAFLMHQFFGK